MLLILSILSVLGTDTIRPAVYASAAANAHSISAPVGAGLSASELLYAEAIVDGGLQKGDYAGAALGIGRWGHTVVERGFGRLEWGAGAAAVDPDRTIYDLASLTKVVATTTAVMLLYEDGVLDLDSPVSRYLPEFHGIDKSAVTIRHLLTHTSGLPAGADIWAANPEGSRSRLLSVPLERVPGQKVEYSDVGFTVLWLAAERAYGAPLYRLLDERVFGPLEMRSTTFLAGPWCERCAPTGRRPGGENLRGIVHDPTARRLGGIAGNAGLFSTVHDLGRFAAMLANAGELDGVRVLRAETVRTFTSRQPEAGTRALGWDTPDPRGRGAAGVRISPRAFGHTGFTGTSLWVDPDRGTWVVLLTNRTYLPRGRVSIQAIRRGVNDHVAAASDAAL